MVALLLPAFFIPMCSRKERPYHSDTVRPICVQRINWRSFSSNFHSFTASITLKVGFEDIFLENPQENKPYSLCCRELLLPLVYVSDFAATHTFLIRTLQEETLCAHFHNRLSKQPKTKTQVSHLRCRQLLKGSLKSIKL